MFSRRRLCDEPILRPEVYYQVCVSMCDQVQQESSTPTTAEINCETKKETISDAIDEVSYKVKSL